MIVGEGPWALFCFHLADLSINIFVSAKCHGIFYFRLMNFLGNIIWLVFGGLAAALGYVFGAYFVAQSLAFPGDSNALRLPDLSFGLSGKKLSREIVVPDVCQYFLI